MGKVAIASYLWLGPSGFYNGLRDRRRLVFVPFAALLVPRVDVLPDELFKLGGIFPAYELYTTEALFDHWVEIHDLPNADLSYGVFQVSGGSDDSFT